MYKNSRKNTTNTDFGRKTWVTVKYLKAWSLFYLSGSTLNDSLVLVPLDTGDR